MIKRTGTIEMSQSKYFFFVIYTIKWNLANIFFKKPKLIVSLSQSDRYDNSVELYSTKQLNLQYNLATDWNGTNPNLNQQVFFRKRLKMGSLQDKNSSFVDELGKLVRKKRLWALENWGRATKIEALAEIFQKINQQRKYYSLNQPIVQ